MSLLLLLVIISSTTTTTITTVIIIISNNNTDTNNNTSTANLQDVVDSSFDVEIEIRSILQAQALGFRLLQR